MLNFDQLTEQIDRLIEIQLELDNFTDYNANKFGAHCAPSKKYVLQHQLTYKVCMHYGIVGKI